LTTDISVGTAITRITTATAARTSQRQGPFPALAIARSLGLWKSGRGRRRFRLSGMRKMGNRLSDLSRYFPYSVK
jgi:hypothetical protein